MAGIAFTTVAFAVFLGTLSEAVYQLAWPPNPETGRKGRSNLIITTRAGGSLRRGGENYATTHTRTDDGGRTR